MAINLDNVTQIIYNNKSIIKIEDSNGNIIWQAIQPGPTRNLLYYIKPNTNSLYLVDMENKASTTVNLSYNTISEGSKVIAYNNELYIVSGTDGNGQKITINGSSTDVGQATVLFPITSGMNGNLAYKLASSDNIYFTNGTSPTKIASIDTSGNITYNVSIGNDVLGNNAFRIGNTEYGNTGAVTTVSEFDTVTNQWITSTFTLPSNQRTIYALWSYNGRLFYDSGANHYEYDFTNNTWSTHTWTGLGNFNAGRIFTDGVDVYQVGGTSTSTDIYKLDISTDTWTLYWTFSEAIRGDYFIDQNGSAQLAQNMRPKIN